MITMSFQTFLRKMFDKGGVLTVGIICLFFQRRKYIPNVFGSISYGIISIGAIAMGRHIIMDSNVSEKPDDISDQIPDCLLEEMPDKLQKLELREHRKKEILKNLHRILSQKERNIRVQSREKQLDILSQEFLQQLEKELQLKPEERDCLQRYFKSFDVYFSPNNLDESDESRSDDSDMEINQEEIQMFTGVD